MKEKNFKNAIEEIQKITMTVNEKKFILERVYNSAEVLGQPVRSFWMFNSFMSIIKKNHLAFYSLIVSFVVLTSSGIVFASQESLPSSILYPIKVKIIEPIKGALVFSYEAKAEHESNLATTRLIEAEILADQGNLNTSNEKKINDLLTVHTKALNIALDQTQSSDKVDEIVTNFQAGMNAHAKVLDIITEQGRNISENKVQNIQVSNNNSNEVSNNARANANRVKDKLNNKGVKMTDNYAKRKNDIKLLIDSTADNLNNAAIDASPMNQVIILDVNKTLDEAQQFLKEADKQENNGYSNNAYSSLLNSLSSAKEAKIFLKTGLQHKEKIMNKK